MTLWSQDQRLNPPPCSPQQRHFQAFSLYLYTWDGGQGRMLPVIDLEDSVSMKPNFEY